MQSGEVVPLDAIVFGTGYSIVSGLTRASNVCNVSPRIPWTGMCKAASVQCMNITSAKGAPQRIWALSLLDFRTWLLYWALTSLLDTRRLSFLKSHRYACQFARCESE